MKNNICILFIVLVVISNTVLAYSDTNPYKESKMPSHKQWFNEENLKDYVIENMREYNIPGMSLALIKEGEILAFEFGVKDSISKEPVTSSTIFEGASLSKPLIAYAALKLCEQGFLDIDQPLSTYFDSLTSIDDPALKAVTLRHILSHTAGFPAWNLKKGESLKLLECPPGSQFVYSGESFRYLGRVIECSTGSMLATHMQEEVFNPLKMLNSSFVWEERFLRQAASPHTRNGLPTEKWKPLEAIASFSLHTTAVDFAKFMIAVRQYPQMLEVNCHINEHIAWGLGWGIEMTPDGVAYWHSGDNGTFQCLAFQNQEIGIVIMTNSLNGLKIYRKVFDFLVDSIHPLFEWEQFDTRADENLDEEYLSNWWKNY